MITAYIKLLIRRLKSHCAPRDSGVLSSSMVLRIRYPLQWFIQGDDQGGGGNTKHRVRKLK